MSVVKKKAKPSPETRRRNALKVALTAIADAKQVQADTGVNRSTRTRTSYKVQAEALHRVVGILEGKE